MVPHRREVLLTPAAHVDGCVGRAVATCVTPLKLWRSHHVANTDFGARRTAAIMSSWPLGHSRLVAPQQDPLPGGLAGRERSGSIEKGTHVRHAPEPEMIGLYAHDECVTKRAVQAESPCSPPPALAHGSSAILA